MRASLRLLLIGAAVTTVVALPPPVRAQGPLTQPDPLTAFRGRITEYATLKSMVAASVPDRHRAQTYESYLDAVDRLRLAVQHARQEAPRGNMFVPAIEPLLRQLIAETLRDHGIAPADLRADMRFDRRRHASPVRLNDAFPFERAFVTPSCLLETLPALPRDMQYRLDDRHLVLVDIEIKLVLDILPDALPER